VIVTGYFGPCRPTWFDMRLLAALSGELDKIMADELKGAERAVTTGVRQATEGLKTDLRTQITAAGMGQRLAKTWRGEVYPKGQLSLSAAGLVFSRAPTIVSAHDRGVTIRSKDGFWLAIPLPAAGRGRRGKQLTPGEWERMRGQRLRFVYRRGKPSLLVAEQQRARQGKRGGAFGKFSRASDSALRSGRGLASVPMFLLVPQVTLNKKLDVAQAGQHWVNRLPSLVTQAWPEDNKP
jgi:hypothetical protein